MTFPRSWGDWAALCAVLAVIWAITVFVMHAIMGRYFATRAALSVAEARIVVLEGAIQKTATHADVARLGDKLETLLVSVSGLGESLKAVKHTTDLLMRHELGEQ